MALIHEVTQNFSYIMQEKFSKFTETCKKISGTLESQSKHLTLVEQRVSDVEDVVTKLEGDLLKQRRKLR